MATSGNSGDKKPFEVPPPSITFAGIIESAPDFVIAYILLVFWITPMAVSPHLSPVRVEAIITLEFFAILSGWFMSFAFMLFNSPVLRYIVTGMLAYVFVIGFGSDFARLSGEAWPILSLLGLMINRATAALATREEARGAFLFAWSILHFLMMMGAFMIQAPFPIPDLGLTPEAVKEMALVNPPLTAHAAESMAHPDKYMAWTFLYFAISGAVTLFYLGGLKERVETHMGDPARNVSTDGEKLWTFGQQLAAVVILTIALIWMFDPLSQPRKASRSEEAPWRAEEALKLHQDNLERIGKESATRERRALEKAQRNRQRLGY
ncbi:MAG: hypothetical protein HY751_06895 [Nitrospinae bacterium]|nr:hypothetical protein [Nitrospinota bacterium]